MPKMSDEQLLIVDANAHAAQAMAELLTGEGYRVLIAQDSEHALGLAQQAPPLVVFADRWCGKTDGLKLIRELQRGPSPPIGVIMTTGDGVTPSSEHILHLAKPLDFERVSRLTLEALALQRSLQSEVTAPESHK